MKERIKFELTGFFRLEPVGESFRISIDGIDLTTLFNRMNQRTLKIIVEDYDNDGH